MLEIHYLELPKLFDNNVPKDDKERAAYESREAELHDQMTRLKRAKEEGIKEVTIKNGEHIDIEIQVLLKKIRKPDSYSFAG